MTLLFVLAGAAIGAPLRYLTDRAIQARYDAVFPWGTFTVNVIGSLILGAVAGATTAGSLPHELQYLIGTGFCGALTTYSTFSYETLRLVEQNAKLFAAANLTATVVAAIGGAFLGTALIQTV